MKRYFLVFMCSGFDSISRLVKIMLRQQNKQMDVLFWIVKFFSLFSTHLKIFIFQLFHLTLRHHKLHFIHTFNFLIGLFLFIFTFCFRQCVILTLYKNYFFWDRSSTKPGEKVWNGAPLDCWMQRKCCVNEMTISNKRPSKRPITRMNWTVWTPWEWWADHLWLSPTMTCLSSRTMISP